MEHQKIIDLLDNTPNQSTKFRTKMWVEINDDAQGTCNSNSQNKFKTSLLKSSLCDYNDAYILMSGTITVSEGVAGGRNNNIELIFKNCDPFTYCTSDTLIYNAKDINIVMPMYII